MADLSPEAAPTGDGDRDEDVSLDVRPLPHGGRHQTIFAVLERLKPQQALLLTNDHDPAPLHYQIDALYPGAFTWIYLERSPEKCRVEIRKVAVE